MTPKFSLGERVILLPPPFGLSADARVLPYIGQTMTITSQLGIWDNILFGPVWWYQIQTEDGPIIEIVEPLLQRPPKEDPYATGAGWENLRSIYTPPSIKEKEKANA